MTTAIGEAAGTAEFLSEHNCRVQVIASHSLIGEDIEAGTPDAFLPSRGHQGHSTPSQHGASRSWQPSRQSRRGIQPQRPDRMEQIPALCRATKEWIEGIDWVVPVIGRRSREDLFLQLKESSGFDGVQIERVGDCVVPRLIQSVLSEAFTLAQTL